MLHFRSSFTVLQDPRHVFGIFWAGGKFPIAILLLELLTLTEIIYYKFYICVNIVLPSKVRAQITQIYPERNDYRSQEIIDADMGRRWAVKILKSLLARRLKRMI
jgi:hypothetical protein